MLMINPHPIFGLEEHRFSSSTALADFCTQGISAVPDEPVEPAAEEGGEGDALPSIERAMALTLTPQ